MSILPILSDDSFETRFKNRQFAGIENINFLIIIVCTHDEVTDLRQTCARHQSNVTCTYDRYPHVNFSSSRTHSNQEQEPILIQEGHLAILESLYQAENEDTNSRGEGWGAKPL